MKSTSLALCLCASLAHAQIGDSKCEATCAGVVGITLAAAVVIGSHVLFIHGLGTDNVSALKIGGWFLVVEYGVSALFAMGFVVEGMINRRDVGAPAGWLAASVGMVGLATYGLHRATNLPAAPVTVVPLPGGAAALLTLPW